MDMFDFVRKLTHRRAGWYGAVISVTLLPGISAQAAGDDAWQDLDEIKSAATDYLSDRLGGTLDGTSVEAGFLDPRLRLPDCSSPLSAFLNAGADVDRVTTVGVRCSGDRAWKVYVPVSMATTATVAVASRHLPKGSVVTADSLRLERRDVTRSRRGYYSSIEAALGQRVLQTVLKGRMLSPDLLEANRVIRRGQSVTLVVMQGTLRLNMAGKALIDGAIGQRISVENLSSGRTVEGIVRSPEHVEVLVAKNQAFFSGKAKALRPRADTRLSNNDR
ncbi:MAG: flagellar basal body P-ring formation chaperone FlgA [Pseudomonadota bacterium]